MTAIKTGKCMNFGRCTSAKDGTEQSVLSSEPFICTECQFPLTEVVVASTSSSSNWATIIVVLLITVLSGAAAYLFFSYRALNDKVVNLEKTEKDLNQEIGELVQTDSLLRIRIKVTADSLMISQKELADLRIKIKKAYQSINFLEQAKQLTREEAQKFQNQLASVASSLEKYTGESFQPSMVTETTILNLLDKERADYNQQIAVLKEQLATKDRKIAQQDSLLQELNQNVASLQARIKPEYRVEFTKPVLLTKKTFGDDTYRIYFDIIVDESERVVKPGSQFRAYLSPTPDRKSNPTGELTIQITGNKLFVDYGKDNFEGSLIITSNDKPIGSYSLVKAKGKIAKATP